MAAARSRTPSLEKMAPTWVFTVASLTMSAVGDLGVGGAPGHVAQDVVLALGQLVDPRPRRRRGRGTWSAERVEDPRRHLGVEPGRAAGHGPGGGDQVVGRGVLEDEAGRAGVERAPQGVVVVEGREDQHRRLVAAARAGAGWR